MKGASILWWLFGIGEGPNPPASAPLPLSDADRFVCGVPGCRDGRIVLSEVVTVVECDTHNARTTHDTVEREKKTQRIIRVQDNWRRHGVSGPPK